MHGKAKHNYCVLLATPRNKVQHWTHTHAHTHVDIHAHTG